MSAEQDRIDDRMAAWLERQPVFFVGTAPSSLDGHINISPKGLDSFRVIGERRVVYQDLTGSGVETIAHLRDNGRIVLAFCAFEGPPNIVRLHGNGTVVLPGSSDFEGLASHFDDHPGRRAFIQVNVNRISTSCGYAVPLMRFEGPRDVLDKWCSNKTVDQLAAYRAERNATSIDGLPAYPL